MKKIMLWAVCGLVLTSGNVLAQAQRKCGAELVKERLNERFPEKGNYTLSHIDRVQMATDDQSTSGNPKAKTTATVTIPVVFHLVLTQAQVNQLTNATTLVQRATSQIAVLNEDYAKLNADTSLIPTAFKPLASATNIRFGLAHRKPDGTSTPGYDIAIISNSSIDVDQGGSTGSGYFGSDAKYSSAGGINAWDPTRYINVWVINPNISGILGITLSNDLVVNYGFPNAEKGICLNYGAFGRRSASMQFYLSGIDRGRTLTHEMGHFFELSHIWGDDAGCPPGTPDDGISDTPPQASEHYGCPSFPTISCSNGPNGDMFMNYMDYTNDACMQMFTFGQANVMNAMVASGGESNSLTQHPELTQYPESVADASMDNAVFVYPNPAVDKIVLNINDLKGLEQINVINMMGQTVKHIAIENSSISKYDIDMSGLSKGVYSVQCTFAAGTVTKKIILQ